MAPRRPHWNESEVAFFVDIMKATLTTRRRGFVVNVPKHVAQGMIAEQARHLPGGDAHDQDPWPPRTYTAKGIKSMLHRKRQLINQAVAQAGPEAGRQDANPIGQLQQPDNEEFLNNEELLNNEFFNNEGFLNNEEIISAEDQEFEAAFIEAWEREFGEPYRANEAREAVNPVVSREAAAAQLNAILQQPDYDGSQIETSRQLLASMAADKATEDEFWNQFQQHFGNQ